MATECDDGDENDGGPVYRDPEAFERALTEREKLPGKFSIVVVRGPRGGLVIQDDRDQQEEGE